MTTDESRAEGEEPRPRSAGVDDGRLARRLASLRDRYEGARGAFPVVDLVVELGRRYRRVNASVLVGNLAYRGFLWLVPFTLVIVALLGFGAASVLDVVSYGDDVDLDTGAFQSAEEQASGARVQALVLGFFGLVVATWSAIRGLHYVFSQAWGVEIRRRRGTIRATAMALVSVFVAFAAIAITVTMRTGGVLLSTGAAVANIGIYLVLLLALSWVMPRRTESVLDLVPGVALATAGLTAIDLLGRFYFPRRLDGASELYGAYGVTLVTLAYLFVIAFLLVASALVNAVWSDRHDVLGGRPYVAVPELLPAWVRRVIPGLPTPTDEHESWPPGPNSSDYGCHRP